MSHFQETPIAAEGISDAQRARDGEIPRDVSRESDSDFGRSVRNDLSPAPTSSCR